MKLHHSKILKIIQNDDKHLNPILFYGNEGGLISKLIKSIYNIYKERFDSSSIIYIDQKKSGTQDFKNTLNERSLFSKINFVVLKNPQDKIIEILNNIATKETLLIINGEGLTSKSKIKEYFDKHKTFKSVPCYKLTKNEIKQVVDDFFLTRNIVLEKKAYWFLIENISEEFLILESELEKIRNFNCSPITLDHLQKLIVQKNNASVENYFFNCANGDYKSLIKEMNISYKSIEYCYEIIGNIKRFVYILINAVNDMDNYGPEDLTRIYLPKHLFLKKDLFKNILKRINIEKINNIALLIQKTEHLLRKNSQQHSEITERFLLNVAKIIK